VKERKKPQKEALWVWLSVLPLFLFGVKIVPCRASSGASTNSNAAPFPSGATGSNSGGSFSAGGGGGNNNFGGGGGSGGDNSNNNNNNSPSRNYDRYGG